MRVTDIRLLKWICGVSRKCQVENKEMQQNIKMTSTEEKLRKGKLRWFGQVAERHARCRQKMIFVAQSAP